MRTLLLVQWCRVSQLFFLPRPHSTWHPVSTLVQPDIRKSALSPSKNKIIKDKCRSHSSQKRNFRNHLQNLIKGIIRKIRQDPISTWQPVSTLVQPDIRKSASKNKIIKDECGSHSSQERISQNNLRYLIKGIIRKICQDTIPPGNQSQAQCNLISANPHPYHLTPKHFQPSPKKTFSFFTIRLTVRVEQTKQFQCLDFFCVISKNIARIANAVQCHS